MSYEHKHNEANGEDNRDGTNDNFSRNWGVEGPTAAIEVLRHARSRERNFLATLAFSQGVPMLAHGDEIARTQDGNNNAYWQDNELSWIDWDLDEPARDMLAFTRQCSRSAPPSRCCGGAASSAASELAGTGKDVAWLRPDGQEMTEPTGTTAGARARHADPRRATDEIDDRGRPIVGARCCCS